MKSRRIKELEWQIQRLIGVVNDKEGKSFYERFRDIKKLKNLLGQLVLQRAMELPTREEAKAYLEKNNDISVATKEAVLLEKEIDPPPEGFLTGEDALAAVSYPPMKYYDAIRYYSADTDHPNSYYRLINTSLRKNKDKKEKDLEDQSIKDPNVIKAKNDLIEMFNEVEPLKESIRLYRGIPKELADKIFDSGFYFDGGFSSFSTDLGVAVVYSGSSKCILVLDVDRGSTNFLKIGNLSRNFQEREVLLRNQTMLGVKGSTISKDGFRLIYLAVEKKL